MKTITDYIKQWFEITGFNWDTGSWKFHLAEFNYQTDYNNRNLKEMIEKYNSEKLAFFVLRSDVNQYMKKKVSLQEVREGKFNDLLHLIDEIEKSEYNKDLREFRKNLELFMAKPNVLGNISDDDICEAIADVSMLSFMNFECLQTSGRPVKTETRISKDIFVVGSIGELILKASSMPDGMFLAFVTRDKDAESYFSLILKSNGNIVSINDRAPEKFFGQNKRRRTDRYTEDKAYSMFPYESVLETTYKESGVHVLVDSTKPKSENMSFDDFSIEEGMRFYIGCILVLSILKDKVYGPDQIVWTTALTNANVPLLESKALITRENRDIVEAYNRNLRIEIPIEEITKEPEVGNGNTSATLFREWFSPDMVDNRENWADVIPDILENDPEEFLSDMDNLKRCIILRERENLVKRMENRMDNYLANHGNGREARDFFRKTVLERKDIVLRNLMPTLSKIEKWKNEPYELYTRRSYDKDFEENQAFMPFNILGENCSAVEKLSKSKCWYTAYLQDDGGICNLQFTWNPVDIRDICDLLGMEEKDMPKEMRGWKSPNTGGNRTYGNSILDFTDPCQALNNPLYRRERFCMYNSHDKTFDPRGMFSLKIVSSKRQWRKTYAN